MPLERRAQEPSGSSQVVSFAEPELDDIIVVAHGTMQLAVSRSSGAGPRSLGMHRFLQGPSRRIAL
jgi:hypothetical protein